jgi:DNA-binding NarL/FixJ family response regulator
MNLAKQVLIVDDHDGVHKGLRLLFELESGFRRSGKLLMAMTQLKKLCN